MIMKNLTYLTDRTNTNTLPTPPDTAHPFHPLTTEELVRIIGGEGVATDIIEDYVIA